jgi:hypothetical protein
MMFSRTVLSTLLVGAACMTGLVACGSDSTKVSDSSFVDKCKTSLEKDATAKAYADDICKCVQDKLKAQGLGDKSTNDKSVENAAHVPTAACTRQALTGQ